MKRILILSTLAAACTPTTLFTPATPGKNASEGPTPHAQAMPTAEGPDADRPSTQTPDVAPTAEAPASVVPDLLRDALQVSAARGLTTADANPSEIKIRSLSYAGSGCPANSVVANISPDAKALTVAFDQYTASLDGSFNVAIGPGLSPGDARRNCQLSLSLDVPVGYTYTLFRMDVRGFMSVEAGIRGTIQSDFYFQGEESKTIAFKDVTEGPYAGDFELRLEPRLSTDVNEQPWSTCAGEPRSLNINTQIFLARNSSGVTGRGHIALDSVDGELVHQYGIKWAKCLPPPPPPPPPAAGQTLINMYPYDVTDAAGQPTLKNRIYFPGYLPKVDGYKIVLPYFSVFPAASGSPGQNACGPVQMVQCRHTPNGVFYSWVESCLPGDATYPSAAWICRAPVAGKTLPLHLLYSPTYGSITANDPALREALIRDFRFHDLGVLGHAPITDL